MAAACLGCDADCVAATVGELAGTLTGSTTIPSEWVKLVDADQQTRATTVRMVWKRGVPSSSLLELLSEPST